MRLLPSVTAASFLLLALSTPALAGGPPGSVEPNVAPVPVPATPSHTERYGKQILIADLLWMGATTLVASAESGGDGDGNLGAVLYLGYFAGGPIIHLKHGNGVGAAKSLAARALLPAAGMLIGGVLAQSAADDGDNTPANEDDIFDDDEFAFLGGMLVGGAIGMASAMILDWTTFSKKTVEGRPASWAVAPNVAVTPHGAMAGLGGSF